MSVSYKSERVGPPLSNDAHWLKFVRVLSSMGVDEAIINQLEEFRRAGKLLTGMELELRRSRAMIEFWFNPNEGIFFAGEQASQTLYESLEKLVGNG